MITHRIYRGSSTEAFCHGKHPEFYRCHILSGGGEEKEEINFMSKVSFFFFWFEKQIAFEVIKLTVYEKKIYERNLKVFMIVFAKSFTLK